LLAALLPLLMACQLTSPDEVDRSSSVARGSGGSAGHDMGTLDWGAPDSAAADAANREDTARDVPMDAAMLDQPVHRDSAGSEQAERSSGYDAAVDRLATDDRTSIDMLSVGLDSQAVDADQRYQDGADPTDQDQDRYQDRDDDR